MAIDRQAYVNRLTNQFSEPAYGLIPDGFYDINGSTFREVSKEKYGELFRDISFTN